MTSRDIQFHYLNKDELQYEVTIRSDTPADTVLLLRKQLRKLLQECPSEELVETELDPTEEVKIVEAKLRELKSTVERSQSKGSNLRARALGTHLLFRLSRIQPEDVCTKQKVNTMSDLLNSLLSKVELPLRSQVAESDYSEVVLESGPSALVGEKCVAKWNVKFNGLTDPRSFLDRVEDLRRADGVSFEKLLNSAARLFVDQALVWFRAIRPKVTSWQELQSLLLDDFSAVDYDYKLLGEIRLRSQGADEPLHIYFSIMECMFNRLKKPLPEEEKLEILQRNIRPFYSQQLALVEVTSVDDLLRKCKVIEKSRQRCMDFMEPEKQKYSVLSSEFLYRPKKHNLSSSVAAVSGTFTPHSEQKQGKPSQNLNNMNKQSDSSIVSNKGYVGVATSGKKVCFKCGKPDHNFSKCTKNVNYSCYQCGKVGHIKRDCRVNNGTKSGSKNP